MLYSKYFYLYVDTDMNMCRAWAHMGPGLEPKGPCEGVFRKCMIITIRLSRNFKIEIEVHVLGNQVLMKFVLKN